MYNFVNHLYDNIIEVRYSQGVTDYCFKSNIVTCYFFVNPSIKAFFCIIIYHQSYLSLSNTMSYFYLGTFPKTKKERVKFLFQWKDIAPEICEQIPMLNDSDELANYNTKQLIQIHKELQKFTLIHNKEQGLEIQDIETEKPSSKETSATDKNKDKVQNYLQTNAEKRCFSCGSLRTY